MTKKLTIIISILFICSVGFFVIQVHNSVYAMESVNQNKINILSKAVLQNDLDLVEELINDKEIDINKKDSTGKFPLEMVLIMENCEMAEILLENGANPFKITSSGQSVYEIVMENSNEILKRIFIEKGKNYNRYTVDQLSQAVLENDINTVYNILSSKTVNINKRDSNGKFPLEMVLVMGNCDMAKILLEAGADPYLTTTNGKTIYELVISNDNLVLKQIFKMYK